MKKVSNKTFPPTTNLSEDESLLRRFKLFCDYVQDHPGLSVYLKNTRDGYVMGLLKGDIEYINCKDAEMKKVTVVVDVSFTSSKPNSKANTH